MKESKISLFTQIKSNKKVLFLVSLIAIALAVMMYNSYRLLSDVDKTPGQREHQLITELQTLFTTIPVYTVALGSDVGGQPAEQLRKIEAEVDDKWGELKEFPYLSSDIVWNVNAAINDLFVYIDDRIAGRPVETEGISKPLVPFIKLQVLKEEVDQKASQPRNSPKVQAIVVAVAVIALSLIAITAVLWVDASNVLKVTNEENVQHQSAILRLLDELADLADGDLTVAATVSEDFTGAIADSVNYTIDQLRQLVSRINRTAVQVSGAAQESQQTALHLAEASDHQAQEIAGASAAINEMAVTIDQVSANAAESALVASKSVSIANNGAQLVQNTIHGMDTIREQIQDTSKRIKRLGESSQEIGDIVSLINDIADQTNILALNAAIQASMAGDAGRGFAVVADEVQRLAERSAAATKQIETLVKTIQSDTNEAVISMEQTTTEVVGGARLAQDAGVALEEIEGVSANIAELIQNISNAARQQASSAGHISNTMNVIQEITSQTSAGTGATAHAIGDLADMALELRESVAGFKLPDDMGEAESEMELPQEDMSSDREAWLSGNAPEDSAPADAADFGGRGEKELSLSNFDDEMISQASDMKMASNAAPQPSLEKELDLSLDDDFHPLDDGDFDITEEPAPAPQKTKPAKAQSVKDDFDLDDFEFIDETEDADIIR